ncbi:DUF6183 family protein [Streptomyces sp. NPDC046237]|uniref:DUF6183 family protein n=1 Tax=Streptomyces sp. NPDC046237 TaxID=3154914 RepID=UPI0033D906CB
MAPSHLVPLRAHRTGARVEPGGHARLHEPRGALRPLPRDSTDRDRSRAGRAALHTPDDRRAEVAVDPFAELGRSAAEFFTLPVPLDPADFNSALLTALGATSLAGLTTETLAAAHTTADDVIGDLYVAAASGGMWGDSRPGAYCRLSTWRALYALMDLDLSVPHGHAVRAAADHRWLRLAPARRTGDFFFGDLSDTAFAVLDPTRTRVAVIAATDTD